MINILHVFLNRQRNDIILQDSTNTDTDHQCFTNCRVIIIILLRTCITLGNLLTILTLWLLVLPAGNLGLRCKPLWWRGSTASMSRRFWSRAWMLRSWVGPPPVDRQVASADAAQYWQTLATGSWEWRIQKDPNCRSRKLVEYIVEMPASK